MERENMQNNYLLVDDLISQVSDFVSRKFIEQKLTTNQEPQKGKVISGTLGTFNIKDFERIAGGIVDV